MNRARRVFVGAATLSSALAVLRLLPGCSQDTDPLPPIQPKRRPTPSLKVPPTDDDEFLEGSPAPTTSASAPASNPIWTAKADWLESQNAGAAAYTAAAPGPFAGKERSHVPVLKVQSDGVAVVVVNHVMDPGSIGADAGAADAGKSDGGDASAPDSGARATHYVSTIWVVDDRDRVVFMKEYAPGDAAPPFIALRIPDGAKTLRAYEHCNLHGVWASDVHEIGK